MKLWISHGKKWQQTMEVYWSRLLVYKVNFFLQVVGPVFVFFFIKYSLWYSIFQGDRTTEIGGYTLSTMIEYHIWTMIISLISMGYTSNRLSEDIRMGRISGHLIYPFSFGEFHAAQNVAQQIVQTAIALFALLCIRWMIGGQLSPWNGEALLRGLVVALLIGWFWFVIQFLVGVLAFWLEETWTLRVILQVLINFLSGAFIPLELFPTWLVNILEFTPFPYLVYYPVKIFLGDVQAWAPVGGIILFWTLIMAIMTRLVWKRGLRLYTAAGM